MIHLYADGVPLCDDAPSPSSAVPVVPSPKCLHCAVCLKAAGLCPLDTRVHPAMGCDAARNLAGRHTGEVERPCQDPKCPCIDTEKEPPS